MFFNPLLSLLKAVQIEIALLSQKPSGLKKLKELAASDGGLLVVAVDLRRRLQRRRNRVERLLRLLRHQRHLHPNDHQQGEGFKRFSRGQPA